MEVVQLESDEELEDSTKEENDSKKPRIDETLENDIAVNNDSESSIEEVEDSKPKRR